MKWLTSIVLVGLGAVGCKNEIPPVRPILPEYTQADITSDVEPQATTVAPITQGTRKTNPVTARAKRAGIPVCDKSTMPGFTDGRALEAAIDGFNARGEDIDRCNEAIIRWAEKNLGMNQ